MVFDPIVGAAAETEQRIGLPFPRRRLFVLLRGFSRWPQKGAKGAKNNPAPSRVNSFS
jgi:hypothetical protein